MDFEIKLTLNVNQAQQLTKLIDSAVRAQGLQAAGAAAYFFQLLSEAMAEGQRAFQRSLQEGADDYTAGTAAADYSAPTADDTAETAVGPN
jgi:hypothetical protein